ncbi:MAG: ROK family protein, partial [Oscillospiraceae bacterium]|nr:ROK family protein [Oscillospiraceae bacterium]
MRIGVDLGGTNIVAGVVNDSYKILARAECKTAVPRPESDICDSMASLIAKVCERAKVTLDDIESIGIGVPGAVNPQTGVIEYSNNLFFHNWEIVKMMQERVNKKVTVENDANAAAYGEYLAGAAKGTKNAIVITLGTGVGAGIVIDGKIYSGSNFAGAEMGHMVIVKDGKECTCGRKGCWEAYASATGLIAMTKDAILAEKPDFSYMYKLCNGDLNRVTGATAFEAMKAGDDSGRRVI